MFRDFILLKPDPPDDNQAGLQVVSGLTLDPEVSTVTIFTCTHCNLYDLRAHWDHNHLGIKSEVFS